MRVVPLVQLPQEGRTLIVLCPRRELNLDLALRRHLFYPLNYESNQYLLSTLVFYPGTASLWRPLTHHALTNRYRPQKRPQLLSRL